jgi:hypothetical protein
MERLIRDLKYAGRSLMRSKGFAAAVTVTLSACVAANAVIFAIVDSVLMRPLPVPNAKAIVLMSNRYPKAGAGDQNISSSGALRCSMWSPRGSLEGDQAGAATL